jgi:two-component system response regulator HydG
MEKIEGLRKHEKRVKILSHLKVELKTKMCGIEMCNFLFEKIRETIPYHHVGLFIMNQTREDFVYFKSVGLDRETYGIAEDTYKPMFLQYLKTLSHYTVLRSSTDDWLKFPCADIFHRFSVLALFPIIARHGLIGCFIIASPDTNHFSEEDLYLIHTFLGDVSDTIEKTLFCQKELAFIRKMLQGRIAFGPLVGKSPKMHSIYNLVESVARTDATILIEGESGTGKELLAQAIHQKSGRKDRPLIVANCAAYAETLIESELFGHEKGAFTGAIRQKKGRFELAHKGTLFLDEVGEIPKPTQVLLLRVLQDGQFERVGGETLIKTDVRIVAATNKDLKHEVEMSTFREDFYYRLNTITISLPPLRERKEDIPLLCRHFLEDCRLRMGKVIKGISPEATQVLMDHDWPGNVRELRSSVERAFILTQDNIIKPKELPFSIKNSSEKAISTLAEHEKQIILKTLEDSSWNKNEAARRLGISRATLYNKIKQYEIKTI